MKQTLCFSVIYPKYKILLHTTRVVIFLPLKQYKLYSGELYSYINLQNLLLVLFVLTWLCILHGNIVTNAYFILSIMWLKTLWTKLSYYMLVVYVRRINNTEKNWNMNWNPEKKTNLVVLFRLKHVKTFLHSLVSHRYY